MSMLPSVAVFVGARTVDAPAEAVDELRREAVCSRVNVCGHRYQVVTR